VLGSSSVLPLVQTSAKTYTQTTRYFAQQQSLRFASTSQLPTIDYEFVKTALQDNTHTIIDVRTLGEHLAGAIPTSHHMDLNDVLRVFNDVSSIDPEDFVDVFDFELPSQSAAIIVYCQSGVRSNHAQRMLQTAGYTNVVNYKGSWSDWASREA
jgi:rhodanese-related sulfurtransferase